MYICLSILKTFYLNTTYLERKKGSNKTFDKFKHNPSFLNKLFIHNLTDHSATLCFFLNSHTFWMQLSKHFEFCISNLASYSAILLEEGGLSEWIADGFCDDINNIKNCSYDGGDCCGSTIQRHFCIECECIGKLKILLILLKLTK